MKLEKSITILKYFATQIPKRVKIILQIQKQIEIEYNEEKDIILNSLIQKSIIDSISYLDEYQQVFGVKTESKFQDRIIQVKAINKPVIQRIKKWKNLNEMRNQLLVHNLRIGKNGTYLFDSKNPNFNAPRTIFDITLLSNLLQFLTITICEEFEEEILNQIEDFNENEEDLSLNEYNLKDEKSVSEESSQLLLEIIELSKNFNKTYDYRI